MKRAHDVAGQQNDDDSTIFNNNNNEVKFASQGRDSTDAGEIDSSAWPLHAKLVPRLNLQQLEMMEAATPETIVNCSKAMDWITDPARYDAVPRVPARKVPYTTLNSADVTKLLECGVVEEVGAQEVQGGIRLFAVPEPGKTPPRRRAIKCTALINEVLGRETLMKIDMATKAQIIRMVHSGDFAVAFDFAAYFDQFVLHPDISRLQCFKKGRKFYRQVTGAMGQRQMVEVAHTATRKLTDFQGRQCETAAIIDNVIFVGGSGDDFGPVLHDGKCFVERVRRVNGTLNEDVSDVEKLIVTKMDWGGVALDFTNKTVCVTEKVLIKMRFSFGNRENWTYRNLVAHFGFLFWAIGLADINPGDFFPALVFYASVCRSIALMGEADAAEFWDQPAVVWASAMPAICAWTERVLENVPRKVPPQCSAGIDWIVCVDSCAIGWGYIAVNRVTGETRTHGERWTQEFRRQNSSKLRQSVFTEPHGVFNTACHLLSHTGQQQRVHFMTDNVATMSSGNKGFNSRSATINDVLLRLRNYFPAETFAFTYEHLPGTSNTVADYFSRGKAVSGDMIEGAAAVMRAHPLFGGSQLGNHQEGQL